MPPSKCESCGHRQRRGKLISCLHTLCIACLERHTTHDGCVKCPNCSSSTPLLGWSPLLCLPDSYPKMESSLDADGPLKQDLRHLVAAFCDECADEEVATVKCADCHLNLCDGHGRMHPRSRATPGHSLTPVGASNPSQRSDITSTSAESSSSPAKRRCAVHPTETVTSFCVQCSQILCARCSETSTQKHDEHTLVSVQDAASRRRKSLRSKLQKPVSEDGCTVIGAIEKLQAVIQTIHERTEASSQDVAHLFSAAAGKLKEREDELLDGLDVLRVKKLTLLEKQLQRLQTAARGSESVSSILGSCDDDVDLLRMCEWLGVAVEKAADAAKNDTKPCATCVPVFSQSYADALFAQISKTGAVSDLADASMSVTNVDKALTITIQQQDGQPITLAEERVSDLGLEVEVLAPDETLVKCCPLSVSDAGTLRAECTAEERGCHLVSAKVDGVHLQSSPSQISVGVLAAFDASQCHASLRLSNGNRTVEITGTTNLAVVRTNALKQDLGRSVTWRVRVDQPPSKYCFVCISTLASPNLSNYNTAGTFGWDGWKGDSSYNGRRLGQEWQAGDVIALSYDATQHTVTGVHERSGATEVLVVAPGNYYGYVNMQGSGTKLTIV